MSRMYYLTRVLLNNGYEKCGGSGGAEYFYNIAEDRHVLGVVVCDSNQTDVISDAGIHLQGPAAMPPAGTLLW